MLILIFGLLPLSANAQTAASAKLSTPMLETFPRITAYLSVRNSRGQFERGLQATDLRVIEDDRSLIPTGLEEFRSGAQLVLAINPGQTFEVRNSQGDSRFDAIINHLEAWANIRMGSTIDDLSVITPGGAESSHIANPTRWLTALQASGVETENTAPDLSVLARAVEMAGDPAARTGMGRAVLLISAPLEGELEIPIQNIAAQASQMDVHIFIWLVAPPAAPVNATTQQLLSLADSTGGQSFTFSGEETLPDLEAYLEPLRSIYQLAYQSRMNSGASHQVQVEIDTPEGTISSNIQTFTLEIQPPNPMFVSPPLEIKREPSTDPANNSEAEGVSNYLPNSQTLQVLVDFPDGLARTIERTSLFVEGELVAENTQPPFDQFNWDLSSLPSNGAYRLRVEAQDSLGLTGSSIETIIQVNARRPTLNVLTLLTRNAPAITALVVLMSGAVLLLVLILGGRITPGTLKVRQRIRRYSDPVTQPVPMNKDAEPRRLPGWANRLQWPTRRVKPQVYAFLQLISDDSETTKTKPIPISTEEITIGKDPILATMVLEDPSVEGLHARIIRTDENSFRLLDEGSVAGTWINYTPISSEGAALQHGDLIHIGQVGLRYTLRKPGQVRKPVIIIDEDVPQPQESKQS
jgi:hypothetical protein